jgi:hypothetical protein
LKIIKYGLDFILKKIDYGKNWIKMEKKMENINENKKIARIAGIWYLVLAIGAGYDWMFITMVYVNGNAALTAQNIIQSGFKYVVAIIFSMIGQIGFTLLGLYLYRLLKQVNENISKIMITLILVSIPIAFANIIIEAGVLLVLKRADYFNVFSTGQIQSISMFFIDLHIIGVHIVEIFWGLWLFPFGYLIYKSNFFPKILAILVTVSGICYCIGSLSYLVNPIIFTKIANILSIFETIGEVAILLWLLIKGILVKNKILK